MNNLVLSPIGLDELESIIENSVARALRADRAKQDAPPANTENKYLTRKETAQKLGISLITLNRRTNDGTLTSYNIGGRVLYREDELENALTENRKKYRR